MTSTLIVRTVYIVSDSTGITAETFSQSVLSQFEGVEFKPVRLPFVDTLEKAAEVAMRIDRSALEAGVPPIVFSTLVNPDMLARVRQANGVFLDLFGTFVSHIEQALGLKSSHSIGRSHMQANSEKYRNRIDAINFQPGARRRPVREPAGPGGRDPGGRFPPGCKTRPACTWPCNTPSRRPISPSRPTISSAAPCPRPSPRTAASSSACRSSPSAWPRSATNAGPTAATPSWNNAATKWPRPSA